MISAADNRVFVFASFAAVFLMAGCEQAPHGPRPVPVVAPEPEYTAELSTERESRESRLVAENGWFSLVGLHWLREGEQTVGRGETNDIVLDVPSAPDALGVVRWDGGGIHLQPAEGVQLQVGEEPFAGGLLRADTDDGGPDLVTMGSMSFYPISRGDRIGLRVRDSASTAREQFEGLDYFPMNANFVVEARFEALDQPRPIGIDTVIDTVVDMEVPGTVRFEIDGREYTLDPVGNPQTDRTMFFMFTDATSGSSSYGAGRYLSAEWPEEGKVTLDFNRAYNPPCAFSVHATCPLPPRQNRLALAVEAGEKSYGH